MKSRIYFVFFLTVLLAVNQLFAQTTNIEALNELSAKFNQQWQEAQQRVAEYAVQHNTPIRFETEEGRVFEMVDVRDGQPEYYVTDNRGAAKTTRVDQLWPLGNTGLNYSGEGYFQLGEWDAGHVRSTHVEFMSDGISRAYKQDGNYATHYHATHVAGTMIAAGVNPQAKGMLYGGYLKFWQWSNDDSEMAQAGANGLEVSNHSYGFGRGWDYQNNDWVWRGNTSIDPNEDYKFGFYDSDARGWDQIARNAPGYLIVKSAGNDRGEGPSDAGNGKPEKDGGDDGFDCIGTRGIAKNILTVGAVYNVDVYEGPQSVKMSDFSCWGPADDGRIKPDIVGKGVDVFSTLDGSDNDYGALQGTSMSAPNVSGSLAMLQYHYNQTHSDASMLAATLKGLAIHTADECGPNDGPDYMYGWGLLNAERAANIISDDLGQESIEENVLNSGDEYSRTVYVPEGSDLTVTICWTDLAGSPTSPQLDPATPMLVNDLDLWVTDESNNTYYPWQLNRLDPAAAATNVSKNYIDNVEKVEFKDAPAGNYTIHVGHDGNITGSSQAFSLIVSGIDDYTVVPECSTNLLEPANGSVDAFLNQKLTWNPALFASSYDVYLGTDGGGLDTPTNVLNGDNFMDNSISIFLNKNTTYYLQVVPRNSQGTADGCTDIWSFTTMDAVNSFPYEEGMEDVNTPDLPFGWQAYNYSEQKWLSTGLISHNGSKAMSCYYDGGLVEYEYDNWFVSLPFEVKLGNEYNASLFYKGFIPGHSESIGIYWGYTPFAEDLTNVIVENTNLTDAQWQEAQQVIIPSEDTLIFIGVHLMSPTGYGAFVDDIKFENWGPVGINENGLIEPLVYSRHNEIVVRTDENWENATINIISLTGRNLMSIEHQSMETLIKSDRLNSGLYLVNINKDGNNFTRKVVVK